MTAESAPAVHVERPTTSSTERPGTTETSGTTAETTETGTTETTETTETGTGAPAEGTTGTEEGGPDTESELNILSTTDTDETDETDETDTEPAQPDVVTPDNVLAQALPRPDTSALDDPDATPKQIADATRAQADWVTREKLRASARLLIGVPSDGTPSAGAKVLEAEAVANRSRFSELLRARHANQLDRARLANADMQRSDAADAVKMRAQERVNLLREVDLEALCTTLDDWNEEAAKTPVDPEALAAIEAALVHEIGYTASVAARGDGLEDNVFLATTRAVAAEIGRQTARILAGERPRVGTPLDGAILTARSMTAAAQLEAARASVKDDRAGDYVKKVLVVTATAARNGKGSLSGALGRLGSDGWEPPWSRGLRDAAEAWSTAHASYAESADSQALADAGAALRAAVLDAQGKLGALPPKDRDSATVLFLNRSILGLVEAVRGQLEEMRGPNADLDLSEDTEMLSRQLTAMSKDRAAAGIPDPPKDLDSRLTSYWSDRKGELMKSPPFARSKELDAYMSGLSDKLDDWKAAVKKGKPADVAEAGREALAKLENYRTGVLAYVTEPQSRQAWLDLIGTVSGSILGGLEKSRAQYLGR